MGDLLGVFGFQEKRVSEEKFTIPFYNIPR